MTISEFENPAEAGNDTAATSLDDTGFNWDYYDPDEDQDSEETPVESATDDEEQGDQEEVAAQDDQEEAEDGESEADEEADEETGEEEASPGVKVTLNDGSEVTLQELKDGFLRQSDYSRKTEATARRSDELDQKEQQLLDGAQHVIRSFDAIEEFMRDQVPPAPPPELAQEDFVAYVQQKAIHDHAKSRMDGLREAMAAPKQVTESVDQQKMKDYQEAENRKLAEHFPEMADPAKREGLRKTIQSATDEVGFSVDELRGIADHRFFRLAHLAAKGLQAEKAKQTARKKSEGVPPVATPKAQKQRAQANKNRDAMKRLAKSGSIYDAVNVDFD